MSNSYVFEIIIQCGIVLLLISDTTTYIVYKCSSTLIPKRQKKGVITRLNIFKVIQQFSSGYELINIETLVNTKKVVALA